MNNLLVKTAIPLVLTLQTIGSIAPALATIDFKQQNPNHIAQWRDNSSILDDIDNQQGLIRKCNFSDNLRDFSVEDMTRCRKAGEYTPDQKAYQEAERLRMLLILVGAFLDWGSISTNSLKSIASALPEGQVTMRNRAGDVIDISKNADGMTVSGNGRSKKFDVPESGWADDLVPNCFSFGDPKIVVAGDITKFSSGAFELARLNCDQIKAITKKINQPEVQKVLNDKHMEGVVKDFNGNPVYGKLNRRTGKLEYFNHADEVANVRRGLMNEYDKLARDLADPYITELNKAKLRPVYDEYVKALNELNSQFQRYGITEEALESANQTVLEINSKLNQ